MKIFYTAIVMMSLSVITQAQIRLSNSSQILNADRGSAFIDASSTVQYQNATDNMGKGLLFPSVDLSQFTAFNGGPGGRGNNYPSFYDGMIVYNTRVGGKVGGINGKVGQTEGELTRGYWYYDNPVVSGIDRTFETGTWKQLTSKGGDSKVIISEGNESVTNIIIDSKPVYAYKGTFTMTAGSTAKVDLQIPEPIRRSADGLYRITIFQGVDANKKYYANGVYSLDVSTGLAVTGSPGISSRYPNGTYQYVIEYLKK